MPLRELGKTFTDGYFTYELWLYPKQLKVIWGDDELIFYSEDCFIHFFDKTWFSFKEVGDIIKIYHFDDDYFSCPKDMYEEYLIPSLKELQTYFEGAK